MALHSRRNIHVGPPHTLTHPIPKRDKQASAEQPNMNISRTPPTNACRAPDAYWGLKLLKHYQRFLACVLAGDRVSPATPRFCHTSSLWTKVVLSRKVFLTFVDPSHAKHLLLNLFVRGVGVTNLSQSMCFVFLFSRLLWQHSYIR